MEVAARNEPPRATFEALYNLSFASVCVAALIEPLWYDMAPLAVADLAQTLPKNALRM
jgi:hypothetical protein